MTTLTFLIRSYYCVFLDVCFHLPFFQNTKQQIEFLKRLCYCRKYTQGFLCIPASTEKRENKLPNFTTSLKSNQGYDPYYRRTRRGREGPSRPAGILSFSPICLNIPAEELQSGCSVGTLGDSLCSQSARARVRWTSLVLPVSTASAR